MRIWVLGEIPEVVGASQHQRTSEEAMPCDWEPSIAAFCQADLKHSLLGAVLNDFSVFPLSQSFSSPCTPGGGRVD